MTELERLAKRIESAMYWGADTPEKIAERLINEGTICPPCKVGDVVYQTDGCRIYESTVREIIYDTDGIAFDETAIGTSVFITREEAEAALAERHKSQ
jgi:hypothetical protein